MDKFANFAWRLGENGSPIIIDGVQANFECSVLQRVEFETHDIFIGEVIAADTTDDAIPPLSYEYYRETLKGKAPKNAPTYVEEDLNSAAPEKCVQSTITCSVCGYKYDPTIGDPDHGIPPGTSFNSLPIDWKCPICASPKEVFE
jgi:rubredoxin